MKRSLFASVAMEGRTKKEARGAHKRAKWTGGRSHKPTSSKLIVTAAFSWTEERRVIEGEENYG